MALIVCTECGKEFSSKAPACPQCGCPTLEVLKELSEKETTAGTDDKPILHKCPSCGEMVNPSENDYCEACGQRITPYNHEEEEKETPAFNLPEVPPPDYPYTICPECNAYNETGSFTCKKCGHKYSFSDYGVIIPRTYSHPKITCPLCSGDNIRISIETITEKETISGEVRKKSLAARTANNMGRTAANMATLGLWGAVLPKRSKYSETQKVTKNLVQHKYCLCQTCGHSWEL